MRTALALSFSAGLASLAGACASQPHPAANAETTAALQCTANPSADEEQTLQLIQGTRVIKSQPLYSLIPTQMVQPEARVNGATLVVEPPKGVSATQMTRALQCHSARAVLGETDVGAFVDDPFVLPGSWLDIGVQPSGGAYAVTIVARDVRTGLLVLKNANIFAENRGGRIDNACTPWGMADPNRQCTPMPAPGKPAAN